MYGKNIIIIKKANFMHKNDNNYDNNNSFCTDKM